MTTEAQKRATARYNAQNYDRVELRLPKGKKAEVQAFAEAKGESMNGFINQAIDDAMQK